jgi:hypothetical protein
MINMRHIEKLEVEFRWTGRPWYVLRNGKRVTVKEGGFPCDVIDFPKLYAGFEAAFASIGATLIKYEPPKEIIKSCQRCGKKFYPQRNTARFCKDCRVSHERRLEENPEYGELNRQRARAGMGQLRGGRKKRGRPRKKKKPLPF